jgi:hypothetical protein
LDFHLLLAGRHHSAQRIRLLLLLHSRSRTRRRRCRVTIGGFHRFSFLFGGFEAFYFLRVFFSLSFLRWRLGGWASTLRESRQHALFH